MFELEGVTACCKVCCNMLQCDCGVCWGVTEMFIFAFGVSTRSYMNMPVSENTFSMCARSERLYQTAKRMAKTASCQG